ncbi:MAG TPA: NUDIX hydrolase N-terminal domain-containing protein [Chloroflexia bacterium]|nr:NUDIX hydrolase N-terminal domain-containing protein [Chloroflexia bacterium]
MTAAPDPAILRWASEIRGHANMLLRYSTNAYDRERAHRLIAIAAEMMAAGLDLPAAAVAATFDRRLDYLTPLVTADAAVFDDAGRILLIQRHDNALWAMPGGACEVEETAAHTAVRELYEETGVRADALALLGVWSSRHHPSRSPFHFYGHVFLCRLVSGTPTTSPEALAVGYFAAQALPPLSPGHVSRVPTVCDLHRQWAATGCVAPFFDA